MRIIGILAAAAFITAAHAQGDDLFLYDPTYHGVPGVYQTADVSGWILEAPLVPAQPSWLRDNFSLVAQSTHASCNIFGQRLDVTEAARQAVIRQLRSMSAAEFALWMNPELDAQSNGAMRMTGFTAPKAYSTDGLEGIKVQMQVQDAASGVAIKLNSYQLFHQAGLVTVTCGVYPEYFDAQTDLFDRFTDDIQFFSETGTLASILNERARLELSSVEIAPAPKLISDAPITSRSGEEAIPQSLIRSARTLLDLSPKGLSVPEED